MKRLLGFVIGALVLAAGSAVAEPSGTVNLSGSMGPFFRDARSVALPAYHITFITQQQGTAVGNITARARLNAVLAGIDEATMRRLTNDAHADLVAQLEAAGVNVSSQEVARAMATGITPVANNGDARGVGSGITIGRSVRRGYASYGANEAPMLTPFHNPTSPTGGPNMMQMVGASNTIGRAAREAGAVAIVPALTIDFINMEASRGDRRANVDSEVVFSLRATSGATIMGRGNSGPGYMQGVRVTRDVTWTDAFATVVEGGAEVREGAMTPIADENYVVRSRARGDAIIADPEQWEGLVRQAYRAFNAALVAEVVEAQS
jgi:hypothetical protein